MNTPHNDESQSGKVVGIYDQESTARQVASLLLNEGGFSPDTLALLNPDNHQIQPASASAAVATEGQHGPDVSTQGVFTQGPSTQETNVPELLRSHLILGLSGLIIGAMVAIILIFLGPPVATSHPLLVAVMLSLLGGVSGIVVGGLIPLPTSPAADTSQRPRRYYQWSVVVHIRNSSEAMRAKRLMKDSAVSLAESF